MANTPTLTASGTQTATISTTHTLATITASGVYQSFLSLENLASGDEVEWWVEYKTLSGGSAQVMQRDYFGPIVPGEKAVFNIPIGSNIEYVLKLLQSAGTGRNFPWKVLAY